MLNVFLFSVSKLTNYDLHNRVRFAKEAFLLTAVSIPVLGLPSLLYQGSLTF
jgi:branched-subunit amino acid permease